MRGHPAAGVGNAHGYDDRAILRDAVEKKANKAHETHGHPLELLVYYDGVFHGGAQREIARGAFAELQEEFNGRWRRMWLYDAPSKEVLG
jgi:hypothetical protein